MTLLEKLRKLVLDGMEQENCIMLKSQGKLDGAIDEEINGWTNVELLERIGWLDQ